MRWFLPWLMAIVAITAVAGCGSRGAVGPDASVWARERCSERQRARVCADVIVRVEVVSVGSGVLWDGTKHVPDSSARLAEFGPGDSIVTENVIRVLEVLEGRATPSSEVSLFTPGGSLDDEETDTSVTIPRRDPIALLPGQVVLLHLDEIRDEDGALVGYEVAWH